MNKRLLLLGAALLAPYLYALSLKDLRLETVRFEWTFYAAFGLYALAVWLVLRSPQPSGASSLALVFGFAMLFRLILVFSQPKLSDDMYRYVWDGRVQAQGINPYRYSPDADKLLSLRDPQIWSLINRKSAVTVYPAGAELAYAAIWRLVPDSVHAFQVCMAAGDLLAGALLALLLRRLGKPPLAVLIYLWSPLVIFETAHSAHIDGLVLPLLVGAWLARLERRDGLVGLLLGAAAALKLYPVLLLPALWRLRDEQGGLRPALSTPLAFLGGFLLPYLPYLSIGWGVTGFLPNYVREQFNPGIAYFISQWAAEAGSKPELVLLALLLGALGIIYLVFLLRPDPGGEGAIRRCIWPIGAFTLLTRNLFPWYMLWLAPLVALFLSSGARAAKQATPGGDAGGDTGRETAWKITPPFRLDAWTGWWLFTGLVMLSYTFFIKWKPVPLASWLEYLPLYAFLLLDLGRWLWKRGFPARFAAAEVSHG